MFHSTIGPPILSDSFNVLVVEATMRREEQGHTRSCELSICLAAWASRSVPQAATAADSAG